MPPSHPDDQDKRNEQEIERLRQAKASRKLKREARRLLRAAKKRKRDEQKAKRKAARHRKGS